MKMLKIVLGILAATVVIVFSLARIAFEIIGASTAPDDFTVLKQRMPRVLEWLFTTPWIVPTLIVLAVAALAAWLLWSGLRGAATTEDGAPPVSLAEVEALLDRRLQANAPSEDLAPLSDRLEAITTLAAANIDSQGRMNDILLKRVAEAETAAEAARSSVENVGQVLGLRIQQANERMDGIATGCAALESTVKRLPDQIDRLTERNRERIEDQLDGVNQAFRAILNREWHQRLFRELSEGFEVLAFPVEQGSGIPDAKVWRDDIKNWRGKLDQWLVIANYYAMGTAENVLSVPEHLYEGDWQFDETKLTANQVHRWKELAIWWHNAKEAKARVDNLIENAAFNLPTQKRRLDPPPRID
jgi:hypothetical protein